MHIDYLCDHPHLIEELAELNFKEWGEFRDGDTLEARTERMRAACGKGAVPSVVVAIEDGRLLGGALLIDSDMKIRPQLTPWLAGVYVKAEERGRGIASQLVNRIVAEAATLTVKAPQRMDLRQAAVTWPAEVADVFCYARGMSYWHSRNRFCGVCGSPVRFGRFGFIGHCDQCRTEHYPRVDPAVIVAVENNGRLLLGRQSSWVARRYSVLAGFVEPGETFEQTVAREVFEEARVRVIQAQYQGTQPWPFPGALMVGFRASAHDDVPTVDGELEDARWFSVDEVGAALQRENNDDGQGILLPPRLSIARTLIEQWYQSQRQCV